ncbi:MULTISPECIES: sugar ABC transporter permease [Paenibacillus]|jgi:multiple sugar transport system permease protein|uniref:carbohydrate ABC transporter permease n=1 Tax=Paenibacillus TaxID=44249 RepID=UPI0003E2B361|nr:MULTISPECIES: sugar ABC transporter permease [Paenibacillus]ETT69081.1 binding-protein-dependent transport system inner membrane protein [Paenibacillus sp. FSL H8-237]
MEIINRSPKRRSRIHAGEARAAYILLIPAFIGLIFLTYLPLIGVLGISLTNWTGLSDPKFIGFENYINLFTTDPYIKDSIIATVYFAVLSVVGGMIYSLFIAMLLNRKIPARGFFRAVFYVPYVLPAAAIYVGWSWLYEANFGFFNFILSEIGLNKVSFIADSSYVVPSLSLISVWLSGNLIVIFLAGLQNVPVVYHEAAEMDGANGWKRFLHITLPCMSPIIFYNLLMSLIANLQIVTPALSLTNGGPGNSSRFLTYLMYDQAFVNYKLGYACATTAVIFVILAGFTGVLFKTSNLWIFNEGGDDK